jgi:Na+/proline symporter
MGKARIGEWFWRFLAAVMLFAVGWTLWIFYQLNPPALVTDAAFEAAAKAKAGQRVHGVIAPAPVAPAPREAPVNAEKLKYSESLTLPAHK